MSDEILRKLQLTQLEMLELIDKICRENKINYSLAYGSVLGAIRHDGFIPWDDDSDIVMFCNDYEKFAKVCGRYLGDKYFLQDNKTERETPYIFSKLRKNKTRVVDNVALNLNINEGVWVDIFILVNGCKSQLGNKILYRFICFYQMLKCRFRYLNDKSGYKVNLLKRFLYSLPNFIYTKIEQLTYFIIKNLGSKKSDLYFSLCNSTFDGSIYKKEFYCELINHKFENQLLPVPKNYDKYLSGIYGDYMKPIRYNSHTNYDEVII